MVFSEDKNIFTEWKGWPEGIQKSKEMETLLQKVKPRMQQEAQQKTASLDTFLSQFLQIRVTFMLFLPL